MANLLRPYKQRAESLGIQQAILDIFDELEPRLTVRQIYYALTVRKVIPKTEGGYRHTIYQLKVMRKEGLLPYGWIADNTRWCIKPNSGIDLISALERMQEHYRRDLWVRQHDYVEIWVEKDALAGVISPITHHFNVPLYVARGYGSLTVLYDAAEQIKRIGKPAFIYHFGDFDPSGVDAAYKIRDELRNHGAEIQFERVAITEPQINEYHLPVRPTKSQDPRAKKWGDKPSVELDALPAPILRSLVETIIRRHIDLRAWNAGLEIEEAERNTLEDIRRNLVLGRNSSGLGNS